MNINYHFDQPPAVVVGLCGHGLSLIQALNEGQIPVIALETNLELPGVHTKLATLVRVSDINGIGLIDSLLELRLCLHCPNKPVLFLTNDNMTRTLATYWDVLEPHYFLSWGHCRETVANLLEKSNLENLCEQQGLRYPPSYLLHSSKDIDKAIAVTGSSAIIKPSKPLAKFKTALPLKRADFDLVIQKFEADLPFLVQKYIPGDDSCIYFCALYLDHGEVLARFDGRKLRSRPMGHTTIAESCEQEDVFRATLCFFKGCNLSGPISVEFKRDTEGHLWVIEPTVGRTDFWIGLCTANRINLPLIEYRNQLSLVQEFAQQTNSAVWFNEERDPFGRLWLTFHPVEKLGKRQATYLFLHKNDLKPALLSLMKTSRDLVLATLGRIKKVVTFGNKKTLVNKNVH